MAIAVIDDDEDVRDSTRALLESYGYTVNVFESAEQFLLDTGTAYDCLLVDHNMPGMSGLDLIDQHRQRRVATPVLLITGRGSPMIAASAKALGAKYLEKPVEEQILIDEIQRAVAGVAAPPAP